jgi:RNA polymerase sigma-70 factor (ECF subfamily)
MITNQQYTCLVEKYIDTVFRIALNYTGSVSDAEDVTQNVFLALLRQKKPFEGEEHIRHWLIRVAVNECKKWYRSPWRKHISFEEYAAALPDITQGDRAVLEAVMALPRKYRMPIYLYYYEEYSTQEIADILKIPKGTVCTNLSRGREMLKLSLEEDEENE